MQLYLPKFAVKTATFRIAQKYTQFAAIQHTQL